MLAALSNPILISVHATGQIKRFQLIEGTMLLSIVPIAYVLLKFFDMPPASVFVVHLCVEMCTQYARIHIVLPMIGMNLGLYKQKVVYPILKVCLLAILLPIGVYWIVPQNYVTFFVVCVVSCVSVLAVVYWVGCTQEERQFVRDKTRALLIKLKNGRG